MGIADQIRDAIVESGYSQEEACRRIWLIDRPGLLTDDMDDLRDYHRPYARPAAEVRDLERDPEGGISLLEAVRHVRPTILVGTSTVQGAFTEQVVREMHQHVQRPFILPMSNPTSWPRPLPADLLHWTDGQALIVTGSPFDSVKRGGVSYHIGQANNALLYGPGTRCDREPGHESDRRDAQRGGPRGGAAGRGDRSGQSAAAGDRGYSRDLCVGGRGGRSAGGRRGCRAVHAREPTAGRSGLDVEAALPTYRGV